MNDTIIILFLKKDTYMIANLKFKSYQTNIIFVLFILHTTISKNYNIDIKIIGSFSISIWQTLDKNSCLRIGIVFIKQENQHINQHYLGNYYLKDAAITLYKDVGKSSKHTVDFIN
jgi:hypothetical protein